MLTLKLLGCKGWTSTRILANTVLARSRRLTHLTDAEILSHGHRLRFRRMQGDSSRRLKIEVFSFACEAVRRETGLNLRKVQISGADGLSKRCVIEMDTGEGKTLTGVPAVVMLAMAGRGCHVVTSNPYLAKRDAEFLAPIYQRLGLSVACVTPESDQQQRHDAYRADITFGTASDFGFDFLRDCLAAGPRQSDLHPIGSRNDVGVHRGFAAAVVDEADSVLIDEASTPLIIGTEVRPNQAYLALCEWANHCAARLQSGDHFLINASKLNAHLTDSGAREVMLSGIPTSLNTLGSEEVLEQVERSLVARHVLGEGRDYLVENGQVVLISHSTGRRLDGRKWQRGLHQAVEAKERLEISEETRTTARITIQEFFNLYAHVSGMTGTAMPARSELRKFYRLKVFRVPTHRRCKREYQRPRVFDSLGSKHAAVIESVRRCQAKGRPVLIGTPSVEASEQLADAFRNASIDFRLLNANQDNAEATIVRQAGVSGAVTIATNMAGRGTDIELDSSSRDAGGLHVIATEIHASRRIDRQLAGRCARQGDPGSYRLFISIEDEIWKSCGGYFAFRPPLRRFGAFARVAIGRPAAVPSVAVFRHLQATLEKTARRSRVKMFNASQKYRKRILDAGFDMNLEVSEN